MFEVYVWELFRSFLLAWFLIGMGFVLGVATTFTFFTETERKDHT